MALDWISSQYRCVSGTPRANTAEWSRGLANQRGSDCFLTRCFQTYNVWFEQHLFAQRHAQQVWV